MAKFIAEERFWELFPEAEIGIVVLKGIDNSEAVYEAHPEIWENLKKANEDAWKWITTSPLSACKVVAVWREAFQKFKKKKGARCSIEALLNRVEKGNVVGKINPLVDIYNAVSLECGFPVGGENLDSFVGDMRLTVSENGGEDFFALGDDENEPTLPGEVCYLDDKGAVCRCWNWRDGQRTMLTSDTKSAFLIIESVDPARSEELKAALDMLAENANAMLGAEVAVNTVVTRERPEVEL